MGKRIAISADSTCDIGPELQERYSVHLIPYGIISEGKFYHDSIDIFPEDIFNVYWDNGHLPQTSAINPAEYREYFDKVLEDYDEVVHITLGGAITSSAKNAAMVAEEDPRVHVVDSRTLSTATGLLVIRGAEMIEAGATADEVEDALNELAGHAHASFILDTLDFMKAGGRCSGVAAFVASAISMKPCIEVDNMDGSMAAGKKYRGKLKSVIAKYVRERLAKYDDIITDHVFITHSTIDQECCDVAREIVEEVLHPKHIYDTDASVTISCHCGPGTLGVLFLTESACK